MGQHYVNVELGILDVHTGHPLKWAHGCYDGLQGLHLEQSLANNEVEELQVQDGPVTPILFGYKEVCVCAVKPAHLLVWRNWCHNHFFGQNVWTGRWRQSAPYSLELRGMKQLYGIPLVDDFQHQMVGLDHHLLKGKE